MTIYRAQGRSPEREGGAFGDPSALNLQKPGTLWSSYDKPPEPVDPTPKRLLELHDILRPIIMQFREKVQSAHAVEI